MLLFVKITLKLYNCSKNGFIVINKSIKLLMKLFWWKDARRIELCEKNESIRRQQSLRNISIWKYITLKTRTTLTVPHFPSFSLVPFSCFSLLLRLLLKFFFTFFSAEKIYKKHLSSSLDYFDLFHILDMITTVIQNLASYCRLIHFRGKNKATDSNKS